MLVAQIGPCFPILTFTDNTHTMSETWIITFLRPVASVFFRRPRKNACPPFEGKWIEMHRKVNEDSEKSGVQKAGQQVAGFGELTWRKTPRDHFLPGQGRINASFRQKISVRESRIKLERGHTSRIEVG